MQKLPQALRIVLSAARPSVGSESQLLLVFDHEVDQKWVDSEVHLEEIKKAVESVVGKEVKISIVLSKEPSGSVKNPYPDLTKIIKKIPVELLDE